MTRRLHDSDHPEYGLPDLIWPPDLIPPPHPPLLLYLDLNHWIGVARASQGIGSKGYVDLLRALRMAVTAERVTVVLTAPLFREVSKISKPSQRAALTELIGELTEFAYLAGLPDVFKLELQASLDARTGTGGLGFAPIELLGGSILHAMGRTGGLRIMREGVDVTADMIANDPSIRDQLAEIERMAEKSLLAGPADADIPALRDGGYRPEIPQQQVRDNAAFEEGWSAKVAPYRATYNLRDLVIARHLSLELLEMITHELLARDMRLEQVLSSQAAGRDFVMGMPSSAVMVSLLAQYHQDPNKVWKQNDIYDIEALAVAVPYCDIVFTDAAARDALMRRHLDTTMVTALPRRPEDLTFLLNRLGTNFETT